MKPEKKSWSRKNINLVVIGSVFAVVLIAVVVALANSARNNEGPAANDRVDLVQEVKKSLDALGTDTKQALASSSPGGYQGDITGVEPAAGDASVQIKVSTYFSDAGDGNDGGKGIARRIFNAVCADVPELKSLYVVGSSGLESHSIYRSESSCK